jgi:hypothetical protein
LTRTRPDPIWVKKIKPIPNSFIFESCRVGSGSDRIGSNINTPNLDSSETKPVLNGRYLVLKTQFFNVINLSNVVIHCPPIFYSLFDQIRTMELIILIVLPSLFCCCCCCCFFIFFIFIRFILFPNWGRRQWGLEMSDPFNRTEVICT